MSLLEQIPLDTLKQMRDAIAECEVDGDGKLVSSGARNLKSGAKYSIKVEKAAYLSAYDAEISRRERDASGEKT